MKPAPGKLKRDGLLNMFLGTFHSSGILPLISFQGKLFLKILSIIGDLQRVALEVKTYSEKGVNDFTRNIGL